MRSLLWEGVVLAVLQGCCLKYFYDSFLEPRFHFRCAGYLMTVLWTICKVLFDLTFQSSGNGVMKIGKLIVMYVFLLFLAWLFYRGKSRIAVFLSVEFLAVNDIALFLAYTFQQAGGYLFDLWDWCIGQGYLPSGEAVIAAAHRAVVLMMIVVCAVFFLILYVSLRKIVRSYQEKEYFVCKEELIFLILPGAAAVCICELLSIIMVTVEDNVPSTLYSKYPVLLLLIPAVLLLLLLSTIYAVKIFQNIIRLNRERNGRIRMEQQIAGMQEHMEEMEHMHSGIRSIKHDMKNILSIIVSLAAENGKKEDSSLQAYLSELNRTMDRLELKFKTGNAVADILLNRKYHEALRSIPDIRIRAEELLFPDTLLIQSYDIGVILGNALDNAVEACRKLKEKEPAADTFIRLYSFQRGKMFFLEIENSFDGTVLRSQQAEFPATDKADRETHGMGFANMKNAAEKYHGAVDWDVNGRVFTVSVMLRNEKGGGNGNLGKVL